MQQLFPKTREYLSLPDGKVELLYQLPLEQSPDALLSELIVETPWQEKTIALWGKYYQQPRLIAWYGDAGATYRYSGTVFDPLPWTGRLLQLKQVVESAASHIFNSVLLNYYRDERDSMGMHADDEPELGAHPVIASLSLGAERDLVFRHRYRKDLKPLKVPLHSGSLLVMSGKTQQYWKHGINKLRRSCGPRVNLTFRQISTPEN